MATAGPRYRGWKFDPTNARLDFYFNGTRAGHINATAAVFTGTLTSTGALTVTAGGLTVTAGGLTVTAGGLTVTAGGAVVTAGDHALTAGNYRAGAIAAFGTTEPTSWIVFKSGTQPAGAITTSGGLGANDTTVQKIIAAGTINNVET